MFGWFRKYVRKVDLFGVSVELHPPSEPADKSPSAEATAVEILPQLQRKFGPSLRPNLKSVKFCQEDGRCFVRMTTGELVAGYLQNEVSKQDDLGFVSDDKNPDGLYFSPVAPLAENVRRFLQDFDELSIINCTDLFTEEAATQVQAASNRG